MIVDEASSGLYQEYNRLVCDGIEQLQAGAYADAVALLDRAFQIRFHEDVNYALYPRLALAYHLAGNHEKAKLTLAEAELAMKVHVGFFRCQIDPQGIYVIADGKGVPFMTPYQGGVADRMCSAFTEGDFYEPRSLEEYLQKADLVRLYFEVKAAIEP